ncbi:MAG: hypothetical protein BGO25_12470 [Acidobacteriales bacterium 59-55]|nr:hypothetical protein [Terriglobales bacterium]ODU54712.1 MAG: hypothetical protein ABT04_02340 [Granulicella sp. SCN 62-9]OJV43947.1 MAG: hypothetical protein BGO25_12470 [Acidobacteriales bacterium 59-55]
MENGKKAAIAATLILIVAVGVRIGMIYHQRNAPVKPVPTAADEKISDDDLVFLKKKRPDTMAEIRTLIGTKLWVSAGGQMDYYPFAGHRVAYGKSAGILLGAEPLIVKDAVEQVAPKSATFRIPGGDRQVSLVFTLPQSADATKEYAVPVGYRETGRYTFYTDEIFFYDDPHELYKHWGPEIWKAVDSHQVILGMNERQVQLSLGQVSKSVSQDYGNRMVVYANLGKPMAVTFVNNKVTAFRPDQGF